MCLASELHKDRAITRFMIAARLLLGTCREATFNFSWVMKTPENLNHFTLFSSLVHFLCFRRFSSFGYFSPSRQKSFWVFCFNFNGNALLCKLSQVEQEKSFRRRTFLWKLTFTMMFSNAWTDLIKINIIVGNCFAIKLLQSYFLCLSLVLYAFRWKPPVLWWFMISHAMLLKNLFASSFLF